MDDESVDFEVRFGMKLIEKTIRQAIAQNHLPGIKIYGEGGNAQPSRSSGIAAGSHPSDFSR
jgi:hypothetical protein